MLELAMATLGADETPSLRLDPSNHLANLHQTTVSHRTVCRTPTCPRRPRFRDSDGITCRFSRGGLEWHWPPSAATSHDRAITQTRRKSPRSETFSASGCSAGYFVRAFSS